MDERVPGDLHRRLVRMQLNAQSRPQRAALFAGVLAGVLFGAIMGLLTASGQMGPRTGEEAVPPWLPWAVGAGSGVFFAGWMGVFFWVFARKFNPTPLPRETDPEALIAARRCLRQGRCSEDPEVDRLVVRLAAQMRAAKLWSNPRWLAWFCGVVFSLGLVANIIGLLFAAQGPRWINAVGVVLFGGFLCVLPWTVRAARRARSLADSIEQSKPTEEQ